MPEEEVAMFALALLLGGSGEGGRMSVCAHLCTWVYLRASCCVFACARVRACTNLPCVCPCRVFPE